MRVISACWVCVRTDFKYVVDLTNTLSLADDPDFAENRPAGLWLRRTDGFR